MFHFDFPPLITAVSLPSLFLRSGPIHLAPVDVVDEQTFADACVADDREQLLTLDHVLFRPKTALDAGQGNVDTLLGRQCEPRVVRLLG